MKNGINTHGTYIAYINALVCTFTVRTACTFMIRLLLKIILIFILGFSMHKIFIIPAILLSLFLTGCASVPLASSEENATAKSFPVPEKGKAGIYIYRDSFVGKALKKDIYLDGHCVGETADRVFFYQQVSSDKSYIVGTESEFSPNNITLSVASGKNYFVRQYIKLGVFVGGAGLEQVSETEGKRVISKPEVKLATSGQCNT